MKDPERIGHIVLEAPGGFSSPPWRLSLDTGFKYADRCINPGDVVLILGDPSATGKTRIVHAATGKIGWLESALIESMTPKAEKKVAPRASSASRTR